MRTVKIAMSVIVALACFLVPAALAQSAQSWPRPMGAGAFPISFTHASAWFAHRADDNQKLITMLVYFEGRAGWNSQRTDFKWELNGNTAKIQMSLGGEEILLKYWPNNGDVEVQGSKYSLSRTNVFLVEDIDSPHPRVRPLGIHDLSFAAEDIPALVLLKRDPDVWAAVSGRSPAEHWKNRISNTPERIVAWDTEGLRLLLTGKPESERQACELFRRAALEGYAASQYRLGYCYEAGLGEDQSFSTANKWYDKAAHQGHVDAQYKLGHSYRVGRGVPIDLAAALQWYKKAAENGDREALHNLGWMYATGQGVRANAEEAYRWFLEAAKRGETGAQFEVARRLREGDGVKEDLICSYAWLLVLQTQESNLAPEDREQIDIAIKSVQSKVGKSAILQAEEQAHVLLTTIAKNEMESFARQQS
ncbi:MAG TPA: tetratricopeptide repeat protein [Terriglobales bacterium]|nr:tetratricopeptide repeat protein [Terriglobales bacterium]